MLRLALALALVSEPQVGFHADRFESPRLLTSVYTSSTIRTTEMDQAVVSWNAVKENDDSIVLDLRVRRDSKADWSPWFEMAEWGANSKSVSETYSEWGRVEVDTLVLNQGAKEWEYRVTPKSGAPKLYGLALAVRNSREFKPTMGEVKVVQPLDVPSLSQFEDGKSETDSNFSRRICSPASLAMVLSYFGIKINSLEAFSKEAFDPGGDTFGNWPFNTATFFEEHRKKFPKRPMFSYARWFETLEEVLEIVKKKIPVVVSIQYKEGELDGASIPTPGHLLVVRGADKDFIYVNDPAALDRKTVARKYKRDQFLRAWKGVAYVFEK